eukprot:snap_masked-scaffold_18-processed-gene-4.19-mRNA-1 protein AED:1.00 eAED:1.00 QI:0/0/0/0/1/1/2/0/71
MNHNAKGSKSCGILAHLLRDKYCGSLVELFLSLQGAITFYLVSEKKSLNGGISTWLEVYFHTAVICTTDGT